VIICEPEVVFSRGGSRLHSKSEDQVYSNDEAYLRSLVAMGKHLLSA
jgi:hypothetical protein